MRAPRAMAVAAAFVVACVASPLAAEGPATLAFDQHGTWHTFWRSDQAPARWSGPDSMLSRSLVWKRLARGSDWASVRLACAAPVWRARVIVARLDPREVALSLAMDLTRAEGRPAWSIDRAPEDAILAVNAGQFIRTMPWGWVAMDGRQRLRPGFGPLSSAVAVDASGRVRWAHGDSLLDATGVVAGFQSYPTLLEGNGVVPAMLRSLNHLVSLTHHDSRLALGQTRDGRLLVVMTRFDAMGEEAGGFPLGPTTPEMAAIMGALGASDAVMLDGGISAQLMLRDGNGKTLRWPGVRKVPLALIARSRVAAPAVRASK
ncbi:MAG TPA: phosphodiester glycosidase family protein [Candidatus Eisenbacteria bacterium]|nr:phosphodiester glycosidase family protein [Candidatus Eisenbacteria bacterium]